MKGTGCVEWPPWRLIMQLPCVGNQTKTVRLLTIIGFTLAVAAGTGCSSGSSRYQGVKGGGVNSTTASDGCGVMMFQQRAVATQGRRESLTAVIIEE